MPQEKGVGGIGEAIRSAAPWPCARRERRAGFCSQSLLRHYLLSPVQYVTLVMDLGPHPMPLTQPHSTSFAPHSGAPRSVFGIVFPTSFLYSFSFHFGAPFEALMHLKCPQAVIQNRPSKNMCQIFGFGSFFFKFSTPMNPRK